jgi:hypothetical protein
MAILTLTVIRAPNSVFKTGSISNKPFHRTGQLRSKELQTCRLPSARR